MVGPRDLDSKASIFNLLKLRLFGSRTIESQKHSFILVLRTGYQSCTTNN